MYSIGLVWHTIGTLRGNAAHRGFCDPMSERTCVIPTLNAYGPIMCDAPGPGTNRGNLQCSNVTCLLQTPRSSSLNPNIDLDSGGGRIDGEGFKNFHHFVVSSKESCSGRWCGTKVSITVCS